MLSSVLWVVICVLCGVHSPPSGAAAQERAIHSFGSSRVLGHADAESASSTDVSRKHGSAEALKSLLAMANSSDPSVRARALEGLAESASVEAGQAVLSGLIHQDPTVQDVASRAVARWDENRICELLIQACERPAPSQRHPLERILPFLRSQATPGLIRILTSEKEPANRRAIAAYCLGKMQSVEAAPILARCAYSPDALVAVESARALAALETPASLYDIIRMTDHPIPEIRWIAVRGLAKLGEPDALRTLESVATNRRELDRELRKEATAWMGAIGDETTVDVLISMLRGDPFLKRSAAQALRRLTGLPYGDAAREWLDWYASAKRPEQKPSLPPPPPLVPRGVVLPNVPPGFVPGSKPMPGEAPAIKEPSK